MEKYKTRHLYGLHTNLAAGLNLELSAEVTNLDEQVVFLQFYHCSLGNTNIILRYDCVCGFTSEKQKTF